jgi:hypothetical protein
VVSVTRKTGYQPPATGRMRELLRGMASDLADPALPLIRQAHG